MFPVLFAIPRTAGWIAQWEEMLTRSRAEDRAAAPDLHRTGEARLREPGEETLQRACVNSLALVLSRFWPASHASKPAQSATPKFDGQRAFDDIRQLVAIGPRVAGTPGAQAARDYIRSSSRRSALQSRSSRSTRPRRTAASRW